MPSEFIDPEDDSNIDALKFYIRFYNVLVTGVTNHKTNTKTTIHFFRNIAPYYVGFGLIEKVKLAGTTAQRMQITKSGAAFYAMLESKGIINN